MSDKIDVARFTWYLQQKHCKFCDDFHGIKCKACWITDIANEIDEFREQDDVQVNIFDTEEVHENCRVTIWSNSITGEHSFGWKPGKRGNWVMKDLYEGTCSLCGFKQIGDRYNNTYIFNPGKYNYCPSCGADMRLEKESCAE